MGKKSTRISPTIVNNYSPRIKPTSVDERSLVSFNFKYLHVKESKFNYKLCDANYFLKLLERIVNVSGMSRRDMESNKSVLRFHQIDFSNGSVTEKNFGTFSRDLASDAWQFCLSSNEHGRVHGFFIGDTYYVVWLDKNHELYS